MPKPNSFVQSMKGKYEINKRLEEGESASNLTNEYQVGKSITTDIKNKRRR